MTATDVVADLVVHDRFRGTDLDRLVVPDRLEWTPEQLRALTATVAADLSAPLHGVLRYEQPRWWARLAVTSGVELWLLTWLPGQHTEPHDHGGASGAFHVLTGALHERYRYPRRAIGTATHRGGTGIGFGAGHAHEVVNRGPVPAASVHAYSPPAVPTREYAGLADIPNVIPPLPPRGSFAEVLADTVVP